MSRPRAPRRVPTRLPVLGPVEAREVDQLADEEFHLPYGLVLETAGRSVASLARKDAKPDRAVALVGKGGNGGIGLATARHLALAGWEVDVALAAPAETLLPASWLGLQILKAMGARVVEGREAKSAIREAGLVLDGLLGFNARGAPRPPMDSLVTAANAAAARRVSVDMPTGVDPSGGLFSKEPVRAEATVMVGFPKKGAIAEEARDYTGRLLLADAGFPQGLYAKMGGKRPAFDAGGIAAYRE